MGPAGSSTLGESEMEGWRRERRRRREKGGTAASERRLAPMHAETLRQPHFSLTRIPHPSTHSSHLPHGFYEDALKGVCVRERGEGEAREAGTALQIGARSFSHHFLSLFFGRPNARFRYGPGEAWAYRRGAYRHMATLLGGQAAADYERVFGREPDATRGLAFDRPVAVG